MQEHAYQGPIDPSSVDDAIALEVKAANREHREVELDDDQLRHLGHVPRPLMRAIRDKCLDCCAGNRAEVRRCTAVTCQLWPLRLGGSNPWRKRKRSETPLASQVERERGANGSQTGRHTGNGGAP